MTYCSSCGAELDENANFCKKCGTAIAVAGGRSAGESLRKGKSKPVSTLTVTLIAIVVIVILTTLGGVINNVFSSVTSGLTN